MHTCFADEHIRGCGHDETTQGFIGGHRQVKRQSSGAESHRQRKHDPQEEEGRQEVALKPCAPDICEFEFEFEFQSRKKIPREILAAGRSF